MSRRLFAAGKIPARRHTLQHESDVMPTGPDRPARLAVLSQFAAIARQRHFRAHTERMLGLVGDTPPHVDRIAFRLPDVALPPDAMQAPMHGERRTHHAKTRNAA